MNHVTVFCAQSSWIHGTPVEHLYFQKNPAVSKVQGLLRMHFVGSLTWDNLARPGRSASCCLAEFFGWFVDVWPFPRHLLFQASAFQLSVFGRKKTQQNPKKDVPKEPKTCANYNCLSWSLYNWAPALNSIMNLRVALLWGMTARFASSSLPMPSSCGHSDEELCGQSDEALDMLQHGAMPKDSRSKAVPGMDLLLPESLSLRRVAKGGWPVISRLQDSPVWTGKICFFGGCRWAEIIMAGCRF